MSNRYRKRYLGRKTIPDRKWSPYWTANDPDHKIRNGVDWYKKRHTKKHVFLYYKKYSIVVMFLLLFFCGKSVTLRDVLYCFLQDLLRITVIHFEKTLVVSNILERPRTFFIGFHFYCVWSTLLRCVFDFSENRGENVQHHPRKMTKNAALDFFFLWNKKAFLKHSR